MPPQFLGNPYEDDYVDESDISVDDYWIAIPNNDLLTDRVFTVDLVTDDEDDDYEPETDNDDDDNDDFEPEFDNFGIDDPLYSESSVDTEEIASVSDFNFSEAYASSNFYDFEDEEYPDILYLFVNHILSYILVL